MDKLSRIHTEAKLAQQLVRNSQKMLILSLERTLCSSEEIQLAQGLLQATGRALRKIDALSFQED